MKKYEHAIEVVERLRAATTGEEEEALALALDVLLQENTRVEREIKHSVEMLGKAAKLFNGNDREGTWKFLRATLKFPEEVKLEIEARFLAKE